MKLSGPLLLVLLLTSCGSIRHSYQELEVEGLSPSAVWGVCQESLVMTIKKDLDPAATDRGRKVMQTKWRTTVGPFRRGTRTRGTIEIEPLGRPPRKFTISYKVEREQNKNMAQSFRPDESDWGKNEQDADLEAHLRQRLTYGLRKIGGTVLGEDPKARREDAMERDRIRRQR